MIKALWFAIKVGLLIAVAVWVADRPGSVRLEWLNYVVTVHMGLFLLILLAIILLAIFSYQVLKGFAGFPASLRRYNEIKGREKGYRALTLGLSAVAAGDTKVAVAQARRAKKLLPEDKGLPLLLDAQAARLDGRAGDAMSGFVALLDSKDASFLGVRGLLQSALDMQDYDTARQLAKRALDLHPKQPWILEVAYGLYVRAREWDYARVILKRAEKASVFDGLRVCSDRAAMFMAEAQDALDAGHGEVALRKWKAAEKVGRPFAPAVVAIAKYYLVQGSNRKAQQVLEKAWKSAPHEAYVRVWEGLLPQDKAVDPLVKLKHMARLVSLNGCVALAHQCAGQAAMEAGLWGEARDYFAEAENIEPSGGLYRLWARLEECSTHDDEAAKVWLGKAADTAGERHWVCRENGRIYEEWQAVTPHGAFNSLEWGHVSVAGFDGGALLPQIVAEGTV